VVHVESREVDASGASSAPSAAATTVSSSTGTRRSNAPPLSSISDAPATASEIARLVAEGIAAATAVSAKVPAPPSSFKLPPFDGTEGKWVALNRNVTQSLEMPSFAPGSDALVTTAANAVQSAQLRNALFAALSKAAANHFDDRDDLKFRGFEMVAILREAYAPTGDDAIFPNFRTLFSLEQGSKEELPTYMARVRTIYGKLKAGGVELPRILLNMFTVK